MNIQINSSNNYGGIYRAFLLDFDGDLRICVPGIDNNLPFINNTTTFNLNIDTLRRTKERFSQPMWNVPNEEAKKHEKPIHPCWVTFENGNVSKPIIMGWFGPRGIIYSVIEGRSVGGSTPANNGSSLFDSNSQSIPEGTYSGPGTSNATPQGTMTGGREVDALFTAYYATPDGYSTAENRLQGGNKAANGEVLDYTAYTCAAPKDIAFNTNIQVLNTGTSEDGRIYRVNDRGGAITVENGVYHFDLLMKDKTAAYAFGRRTGKAIIGGVVNSSSVGLKIVEIAKEQLGKPYVYGTAGPDTFDCSGLVYWCAKKAGVNITRTTAHALSSMGSPVSGWGDAQPGDILCCNMNSSGTYQHVVIIVDPSTKTYIHAPNRSKPVGYGNYYTSGAFRRLR